jgi:hypothetical protein
MRFVPRFLRRDVAVRAEPDPADLGTAFGMEASLSDLPKDFHDGPRGYPLESQGNRGPQESPLAWLSRRAA